MVFFLAHALLDKPPFFIHIFHSCYVTQDYERLASHGTRTLPRKMKQTITPSRNLDDINFSWNNYFLIMQASISLRRAVFLLLSAMALFYIFLQTCVSCHGSKAATRSPKAYHLIICSQIQCSILWCATQLALSFLLENIRNSQKMQPSIEVCNRSKSRKNEKLLSFRLEYFIHFSFCVGIYYNLVIL